MISSRMNIFRLAQAPVLLARPTAGPSARLLHNTSVAATAPGRDPQLSQGNVSNTHHSHPRDAQDQAARSGQSTGDKSPYDAASSHPGKQAPREGVSGNPEGVGFAEQVGSASSGSSASEGKAHKEESTPPGFFDAVKSKLGFTSTSGEAKQNRGGGKGVTGTGSFAGKRQMHWSAVARMADSTKGQAPDASRQPKDSTYSEQNDHLKHRAETDSGASRGKGNAAEEPSLPSHKFNDRSKSGTQHQQQRRAFHTSSNRMEQKHTADSYFKDVDDSPPKSSKTHQVDPSGTGARVTRPNEPDTGEFADTGAQSPEYDTTSKDKPYDNLPTEGRESEEKLRYGGTGGTGSKSGGQSASKPGEGPEGSSAGGHHAEGR